MIKMNSKFRKIFAYIVACTLMVSFLCVPKVDAQDDFTVVFIGGSVTQGAGVDDYANSYAELTMKYFHDTYDSQYGAGKNVKYVNAAIGGTGSSFAMFRLEEDVISKNPDIVFLEFAVNDASIEDAEVERTYESLVRQLLLMPTPPKIVSVYVTNTSLNISQDRHRKISEAYNLPQIDCQQGLIDDIAATGNDVQDYFVDGVHPNVLGHKTYADIIKKSLETEGFLKTPVLLEKPVTNLMANKIAFTSLNDSNIVYNGDWKIETESDYTGEYMVSNTPGDSIEFTFTGTAFGLYTFITKGGGMISCTIDGEVKKSDLNYGYTNKSFIFVSTDLPLKEHKVRVEIDEDTNSDDHIVKFKAFGYDYESVVNDVNYTNDNDVVLTDDLKYEKQITLVKNLGIMEGQSETEFGADKTLTRAEYAQFLLNIISFKNPGTFLSGPYTPPSDDGKNKSSLANADGSFGEIIGDLNAPFSGDWVQNNEPQKRYDDVDFSHWAYGAIENAYLYNLMRGTSANTFDPDSPILLEQVIKTFVNLLGYGDLAIAKGGYPNGYMLQAADLNLLSDINVYGNEPVTRGAIAKLVVNAFPVSLMKGTGVVAASMQYSVNDNISFLREVLGLEEIKGIVTEDECTNFNGRSSLRTGNIKIDDKVYQLSDKLSSYGLIGHAVKAYATVNEEVNHIPTLCYIELTDKDTSVVIQGEDIVSFQDGILSYQENNSIKKFNLKNLPIIYNGLAVSEISSQQICGIKNGTITLSYCDDEKIAVIIWDYSSYTLSGTDSIASKVITQDGKSFTLDQSDDSKVIRIFDMDGNEISFNAIGKTNTISIAQNGDIAHVLVSNTVVRSVIDSYDDKEIVVAGITYNISRELLESDLLNTLKVGAEGELFLDSFGKIAWIKMISIASLEGLLMAAKNTSTFGEPHVLILDISGSEVKKVELPLANKIRISDETGKEVSYYSENVLNKLVFGYINYSLNDAGEINYIQIPLTTQNENGRIYTAISHEDVSFQQEYGFSGRIAVSDNTKIIKMPSDPAEYEKYEILKPSSLNGMGTMKVSAVQEGGSISAKAVIVESAASYENLMELDNLYVAEKVSLVITEDGEKYKKVVAVKGKGNKTVRIDLLASYDKVNQETGSECTAFDIASSACNQASGVDYSIEPGDFFFANISDPTMNIVDMVLLLYRANAKTPSGGRGWFPDVKEECFFIRNEFVHYDTNKHDLYDGGVSDRMEDSDYINIGNPYRREYNGNWLPTKLNSREGITLYYLYDMDPIITETADMSADSGFKNASNIWTTQDIRQSEYIPSGLPEERIYDETGEYSGIYITNMFTVYNGIEGFILDGTMDNFTVTKTRKTSDAYHSYKLYGEHCSKMIRWHSQYGVIVILDKRE